MIKILILFVLLLPLMLLGETTGLEETARVKMKMLSDSIQKAEQAEINVEKEKLALGTAEVFLKYANWDEANEIENKELFAKVFYGKAPQMAKDLPDIERSQVITLLEEAIERIGLILNGTIVRRNSPKLDFSKLKIENGNILQDGRPAFFIDHIWKPGIPELTEIYGATENTYLTPNYINSNGTATDAGLYEFDKRNNVNAGQVFLDHRNIPGWARSRYPNFEVGGREYNSYDIDNPGARELYGMLFKKFAPILANKRYAEFGYMLFNEVSFFTQGNSNTWNSGTVSNFTIDKFKEWLDQKHESIDDLNAVWNTNYSSFDDVEIAIPIAEGMQGTAKWSDWMMFNNHRVNEWFRFLTSEIKKYDPDANFHIKLMPWLWANGNKAHGIDFENLTRICNISGCDAQAGNSKLWGTEYWMNKYAFHWKEISMTFDFFKSVRPNQIILDSETHFLSTGSFRDLELDPEYARGVYWLAHMHGLSGGLNWFWGRHADGSVSRKDGGYPASNNQQPAVMNEVHATYLDLNTFAEEITSIVDLRKPLRLYYSVTNAIARKSYMEDMYNTYEAHYFEGVPLGFATDSIIQLENHSLWDAILIRETEIVSKQEFKTIQAYLNAGGTVIIDSKSLKKNEYKAEHPGLVAGSGTLTVVNSLAEMKSSAFALVEAKGSVPEVNLVETSSTVSKGCVWRNVKNIDGNNVLSVVNIGKRDAKIELSLKSGESYFLRDMFTGIELSSSLTLKPYGTLLCVFESEPVGLHDTINSHNLPDSLFPLHPVDLSVQYRTSVQRDIHVELVDASTGDNYGSIVKPAYGSGSLNFEFNAENNPNETATYNWVLYMTLESGDDAQIIGEKIIVDVDLTMTAPIQGMELNMESINLKEGENVQFEVNLTPFYTTDTLLNWISSDSMVVKVNANGIVTGIGSGIAYVKVISVAGGFVDSCVVGVTGEAILPKPWQEQFIGVDLASGTATLVNDTLTIISSGSDIWNSNDDFEYVFQPYTDDVDLIAKIDFQEETNPWAKVGVMIRSALTDNAKHGMTVVTPSSGSHFQYRTSEGNKMASSSGSTSKDYNWVRLLKIGDDLWSFVSTDGIEWTQVGKILTIDLGDEFYIGMCYSSHKVGVHGTSKFSNISVTKPQNVNVTGINIKQPKRIVNSKASTNLTVSVVPAYATNREVIWSSKDKNTASVSNEGVVTGDVAGVTYVYATSVDGDFVDSCKIEVRYLTSISNLGSRDGVLYYPNPFNKSLNIDLPANHSFENVMLCDLNGRVLVFKEIEKKRNVVLPESDLNVLKTGMYILTLNSQDSKVNYKVFKQM